MIKKPVPYSVVPDSYRNRVVRKKRRNLEPITDPMFQDLLDGKTVLADYGLDIAENFPRTLYHKFLSRGYRLQMYLYDDIDKDIFRGILMWADPLVQLWNCSRCGDFEIHSGDGRPQTKGCTTNYHSWRKVVSMPRKRVREDLAPVA